MQCTGCGKSLSTDELRGENCPYCETALPHRSEAIANAASVKELLRDANQDGVPDILEGTHLDPRNKPKKVELSEEEWSEALGPKDMPSHKKPVEYKKKTGGSGCGWSVFVLVTIGGLIFAIYFEQTQEPEQHAHGSESTTTSTGSPTSGPAGAQQTEFNQFRDACLVDANGDGVDDIAGLAHQTGGFPTVIVDGATGGVLWHGEPYSSPPRAHCLSADWFVVAQNNFQLNFHSVRNPETPVRIMARDRIRAFGMGEGCVAFKSIDGTLAGVTLPAGIATRCKAKTMRRHGHVSKSIMTSKRRYRVQVTEGDLSYELKARRRGTKMLTVTAREMKDVIWSKELPYKKPSSESGIAVAKGRVIVWGTPPSERAGHLIGLDAKSGEQVYVHKASDGSGDIEIFEYNGRALIIHYGTALQAHDVTSGKLLWEIGR